LIAARQLSRRTGLSVRARCAGGSSTAAKKDEGSAVASPLMRLLPLAAALHLAGPKATLRGLPESAALLAEVNGQRAALRSSGRGHP
jgi:hypothetical protein